VSWTIARAAWSGSQGELALFQLVGRTLRSGGITKKIAAKAEMPPAVLRIIAPSAKSSSGTRKSELTA
jgi:hypothetical protein